MQRKNHILKSSRSGFALIMAITVVVVISTIMALSISLTTQTTKRTTDLYIHEQAVLISKSAAEYALLRISQSAPCTLPNLNFTHDTLYDINIDFKYVYTEDSVCDDVGGPKYFTVTTPEQNGSVLMDITVSVPSSKNISNEAIRYFRRVIEKL